MASGVFVFAEQVDKGFKKSTLEAVSEGRRLADALGEPLCAMVLGDGIIELAAELGTYGAEKVLVAEDAALADFTADAYVQTLFQAIQETDPRIVLTAATVTAKELFARLAAKLDTGLAMECTEPAVTGDTLTAKRSLYGGKVIATVTVQGSPIMATLRPNVAEVVEAAKTADVVSVAAVTEGARTRLVDKQLEDSGTVELTEANFVVSGGRGMGGPDYSLLEALAKALGGAVGASRRLRHLRRHPACGRHPHLGRDRGHQQGRGRPHLPHRRLRPQRRPQRGGPRHHRGSQKTASLATPGQSRQS
ncbi:MAG: electron transfer flavoprotein subunit alpha/FixB family protein [Desulfosarcinaceae bacterium]